MMKSEDLVQGKIYFISYNENTQVVGRFKEINGCHYIFYDLLHYWNGFESFIKSLDYCVITGITEMRQATKPEKHTLIRFEIEYDCI